MTHVQLEFSTLAVAYADGLELGSLAFSTARLHFHPRIFYLKFSLNQNRAEVARALYERVFKALDPHDPLLFYTGADEDSRLLPVLRALGFRPFRHVYTPALDVQTFNPRSLDFAVARAEKLGYRVVTLPELESTPDLKRRLYRLFSEVYADTSAVVPATPERLTPDEWWAEFIKDEAVIPEAFFVAFREDEMAGFSNLFRGETEGELETGTFGTARRFRLHHRDVMLALKAREVTYAKMHGYRTIRAEIDAENPLVMQVCAELPFTQDRDHVSLVRVLRWRVT